MALSQHKIPIITGRNDVPTTSESQENHPNGSFTTAKYNALIDELVATFSNLDLSAIPAETDDLEEGISNLFFTAQRARNSISVANNGNASYSSSTGVITVNEQSPKRYKLTDNQTGQGTLFKDLFLKIYALNKINIFYDLSGNLLSNNDFWEFPNISVQYFRYNNQTYDIRQWHSFWFGDIRVVDDVSNERLIELSLDTTNVTEDLIIPISLGFQDSEYYWYGQDVNIIVSSSLRNSILADPDFPSGGSGSGGSGSGGSGSGGSGSGGSGS